MMKIDDIKQGKEKINYWLETLAESEIEKLDPDKSTTIKSADVIDGVFTNPDQLLQLQIEASGDSDKLKKSPRTTFTW